MELFCQESMGSITTAGTSAGAVSWAALLLPPHVVTQSSACAERGEMQIFQLSALLHSCCSLDLSVGSGSLCCIWVTFARDKTSPNYTSFAWRARQATSHWTDLCSKGCLAGRFLRRIEEPSQLDELWEQFHSELMSTAQPELCHCLLSSPSYSSEDVFLNFFRSIFFSIPYLR